MEEEMADRTPLEDATAADLLSPGDRTKVTWRLRRLSDSKKSPREPLSPDANVQKSTLELASLFDEINTRVRRANSPEKNPDRLSYDNDPGDKVFPYESETKTFELSDPSSLSDVGTGETIYINVSQHSGSLASREDLKANPFELEQFGQPSNLSHNIDSHSETTETNDILMASGNSTADKPGEVIYIDINKKDEVELQASQSYDQSKGDATQERSSNGIKDQDISYFTDLHQGISADPIDESESHKTGEPIKDRVEPNSVLLDFDAYTDRGKEIPDSSGTTENKMRNISNLEIDVMENGYLLPHNRDSVGGGDESFLDGNLFDVFSPLKSPLVQTESEIGKPRTSSMGTDSPSAPRSVSSVSSTIVPASPTPSKVCVSVLNVAVGNEKMPTSEIWVNRADEIVRAEVGPEEYRRRVEKQERLFDKGCQKGGFTDSISLYFVKSNVKSLFEKKTKSTKKRATHATGVGALGYAVFDSDPRLPESEFFIRNRVTEVRARHSNFPHDADDAKMGYRSLALKFSDHDSASPLDFILQTGYLSPFFNADSIQEMQVATGKGSAALKQYLTSMPVYLEAALEGIRKNPDSYYHQFYHSQMVYDYVAKDEVKRVARFRVVPADGSRESGRLSSQEQRETWYSLLLERADTDKSPEYLKDEFRERLVYSSIEYKLQAQVREKTIEDTHMIYNASRPWNDQHPWLNVATITLTSLLPDDVTESTRFNIGNLAQGSLAIPEATSGFDFNVVPNLRREIYTLCSKFRPIEEDKTDPKGKLTEYLVYIVTGQQEGAGNMDTYCHTYISLIGSDARTRFRKLPRKLKNDFDRGQRTTFSLKERNIGELLCVKVYKDKRGLKSDWYLDYIIITTPYNNKCYTLPGGRWLTDNNPIIFLREGTAVLDSQEDEHYLRLLRSMEVAERKSIYEWAKPEEDDEFYGLPGYIAACKSPHNLPKDLLPIDEKKLEREWNAYMKSASSLFKSFLKVFRSDPDKIETMFEAAISDISPPVRKSGTLEHIFRNWKSDEEFGRQILNGLNPMKIREIQDLPRTFPVTDQMLQGQLPPGKTLDRLLQEGKLFLVSYPELQEFANEILMETVEENEMAFSGDTDSLRMRSGSAGTASLDSVDRASFSGSFTEDSVEANETSDKKTKDKKKEKSKSTTKTTKTTKPKKVDPKTMKRYLCSPMVLLYNRNGTLVPLAIQLTTDNREGSSLIYTKADDNGEYSDWLVAKMWVKVADANAHQLINHLLGTHLLIEPIAIALMRNLPAAHPLYKLLAPHFRNIIGVNTVYRKLILGKEGAFADTLALGQKGRHLDLIRRMYKKFKFPMLNLPDNFAERGVLDEEMLQKYYYRDDSLKLWEAVYEFVAEIVSVYYEDNEDVEKDEELANAMQDLSRNGLHRDVNAPKRFTSIDELIQFLTIVIFRCSAQHSAVNTGQFDFYGFALNAPPCMVTPPPLNKKPDGWTQEELKAMLPPAQITEKYIGLAMVLAKTTESESIKALQVSLGVYPERLFTETRPQVAIKAFQKRLDDISASIFQRNNNLEDHECPYEYLQPENIPNNIDI